LQGNTSIFNLFCDLVFDVNLVQLVNQPTHSCGNILDLVLTNIEDSIASLSIHPVDFTPIKSDHFSITFSLNANSSLSPPKAPPYCTFNYSKGDYGGLHNHLANIDFIPCLQSHDIEYIWLFIESTVINAMNLHIPKIKIHNHLQPKWYTSKIKHHIKCLRTLRCKYRRHPTESKANAIKNSEASLELKINNAKLAYESKLVNNFTFNNSSIIYNHIRSVTKTKSILSVITFDDNQTCEDINKTIF